MAVAMGEDGQSGPLSKVQRTAAQKLTALVGKVIDDDVGPILGSMAYAEGRLKRAQREGRSETQVVEAAIKVIIRESVAAAGTTGFVTGLGGLVALPVTLPANVAGNLAINARMVGAIAHLRGYTLDDPHTRTAILLTVAGSNLQAAAAGLGVEIGKQVAAESIKAIPIAVLRRINTRAGFYLVAKYGTQRSAVTLARAIPVAGGLVGGSVDAALTGIIGKAAKRAFAVDQD
jgi:EcsC protein family